MKKPIPVLIVEDDPNKPKMLLARLKHPDFDPDVRNGTDEALQRVREKKYQVVIIDLQLTKQERGKEPYFEGIGLGESIRALCPEAVIIMYSGSIQKGHETESEHYDACLKQVGADAVFSRTELFSMTSAKLSMKLVELIENRRSKWSSCEVLFDHDLLTKAACEKLGSDSLKGVLAKLCGSHKVVKAKALQAGFSGSSVFRAKVGEGNQVRNLIVKVSKSKEPLVDELRRRPNIGSELERRSVVPIGGEVIEYEDIAAFAVREVQGMTILRDFLRRERTTSVNRRVIDRFVKELLVGPALASDPFSLFGGDKGLYRFTYSAANEIAEALNTFSQWKGVIPDIVIESSKCVHRLVEKTCEGGWAFATDGRLAAVLHGDFHCRNVFVSKDSGAALIDFGRSAVFPRFFDFASLETDLMIGNIGDDPKFHFEIDAIECRVNALLRAYPFMDMLESEHGDSLAEYLRFVLHRELNSCFDSGYRLEYSEVLLFNLLRYLRFSSVTMINKMIATVMIGRLASQIGIA